MRRRGWKGERREESFCYLHCKLVLQMHVHSILCQLGLCKGINLWKGNF